MWHFCIVCNIGLKSVHTLAVCTAVRQVVCMLVLTTLDCLQQPVFAGALPGLGGRLFTIK